MEESKAPKDPGVTPAEPESPPPRQDWLLAYKNPLAKRMDRDFFRSIPKSPGVYRMLGSSGSILYVGKAKNLRDRVGSYRSARPGQVSRKIIRMLNLVHQIEWELCPDETHALLRENQLLRELKPPFNTVNTRPESYYFIAIRPVGSGQQRFRLTTRMKRQGDLLFGAFKNRSTVRKGYAAMLRLCWAAIQQPERFEYPQPLGRDLPPPIYTLDFPAEWRLPLRDLLSGRSDAWIITLAERLLLNSAIPPFYYRWIQADIDSLREAFLHCFQAHRELRKQERARLIPQDRIDDLLVISRAKGRPGQT